jgi:LAS superfamily LD-carboxypeptidase LdcB
VSAYCNGRVPLDALCPLAVAPGHRLRADAAHAFDALAAAYRAEFGVDLCITDSYRSAASQVQTYAAKPGLAAVPGTSNHGWGTAVDLCGGIEGFGTPQHAWMRDHASLFGWFHPSWAQQGGSRPEPWHWEFGG